MRINLCCREFFKKGYQFLLPKTREEKRNYLRGLMDAEGSVGVTIRKVRKSNNKKLFL